MDYKNLGESSQKGLQSIAIAKWRCEITWIKELICFAFQFMNLIQEHNIHTNGTKICKVLQLDTGHLKPVSFGTLFHNFCFILKNIRLASELLKMWL